MCIKPHTPAELACLANLEAVTARIDNGETTSAVYLERAHLHKQVARLEEAVADITRALAAQPPLSELQQAEAYNLRGICHRRLARYPEAVADADASLLLRPDWAPYWADRGWAYTCSGKPELGLQDFDHALSLDPYFLAFIYRGMANFGLGDYEAALADYDHVIGLYHDNVAYCSFLNRAILRLVLQFDLKDIEADLDVAVRRVHDAIVPNGRPYAYRALVRALQGRLAEAEADLHEAAHLGGDPVAPLVRGWIETHRNQPAALRTEISNFIFESCPALGLSTDLGLQVAARFMSNPRSALPSLMPLVVA